MLSDIACIREGTMGVCVRSACCIDPLCFASQLVYAVFHYFFYRDTITPSRLSSTQRNVDCLAVGGQLHESLPGAQSISRRGAAEQHHTHTTDKTMRSWFWPKQHKLVLDVCVAHKKDPSKIEEKNKTKRCYILTADKTNLTVCMRVSDAHFSEVGVNHVTTGWP